MQLLISYILFYGLMVAIVTLLGLMYWRGRTKDQAIVEALLKSTEAANKAAQAAQTLAAILERKYAQP